MLFDIKINLERCPTCECEQKNVGDFQTTSVYRLTLYYSGAIRASCRSESLYGLFQQPS